MTDPQPIPPTLMALPAELRGQRIVLRPYRVDDADAMFAAIDESRIRVRPWLPWVDHHVTVDDIRNYCIHSAAKWMLRSDLPLGIFSVEDGRYFGGPGLHRPVWIFRSFEIGYWLRASAEGRGFMTEAVNLLTSFAVNELQANRVEIHGDARNTRSRAVAERCGLVQEGRLRNARMDNDRHFGDTLVFSTIPGDR